ncbi:hypothetical protein NW754_011281 [Fusarium falciforme]|nr:hypothetical protein NW754_011281 [Fusarium falciforme]
MSRYAVAHAKPNGPGDARPTALQIIKDEGVEGKLQGEAIVITGTSSGIGVETARALAATGATLYLIARDVAKAQSALAGIFEPSRMELIQMDQASLASVRAAAAAILAKTSKIHLLVNNAGIMAIPDLRLTADGHELQKVADDPSVAYGQSKTANIYMANEIERRYGPHHLHATSIHPGIIQTGLTQHMPPDAFKGMEFLYPTIKSVEQGAATSVWAAIGKAWEHKGGKYLVNCAVAEPYAEGDDKFSAPGYAPYAYDVEEAKRLWSDSLKLVGLPDEE